MKDNITQKDLEKLLTTDRIKRNYKKTKVLIIDEISMLHKHQLDMVDTIARYILDCDNAFGGIQIVLCGDFFQLPPVSSDSSSRGNTVCIRSPSRDFTKSSQNFPDVLSSPFNTFFSLYDY